MAVVASAEPKVNVGAPADRAAAVDEDWRFPRASVDELVAAGALDRSAPARYADLIEAAAAGLVVVGDAEVMR